MFTSDFAHDADLDCVLNEPLRKETEIDLDKDNLFDVAKCFGNEALVSLLTVCEQLYHLAGTLELQFPCPKVRVQTGFNKLKLSLVVETCHN
jgi:hypothetical protein